MGSRKITAILAAALMLMVCVIPMMGCDNEARESTFIDGITEPENYGEYTVITTQKGLDDIRNDLTGKYVLGNDIVIEDDNGGFDIEIKITISGNTITLEISAEGGENVSDLEIYLNQQAATVSDGKYTFATYSNSKDYSLTISGTVGDDDVAIGVPIMASAKSMTVTKNSNGNFDAISGFEGTFKGNGHSITGLEISSFMYDPDDAVFASLFPMLYGTVSDLRLNDGAFTAISFKGDSVASSIGGTMNDDKSIWNCVAFSCDVISFSERDSTSGGIAYGSGDLESCVSADCFVAAISMEEFYCATAGGIVGSSYGDISNSYSTSRVMSVGCMPITGGIAGTMYIDGKYGIDSCFSTYNSLSVERVGGSETGSIGGILGYGLDELTISNCYNTSSISVSSSNTSDAGGILGKGFGPTIKACYSTGTISGITDVNSCIAGYNSGDSEKGYIYACYINIAVNAKLDALKKYPLVSSEKDLDDDDESMWVIDDGYTFTDGADGSPDKRRSGFKGLNPTVVAEGEEGYEEYLELKKYAQNSLSNAGNYYSEGDEGWMFGDIWSINQKYAAPDSGTGSDINSGNPILSGMFPHEIHITDPKDQIAVKGDTVTIEVVAESDIELTYSWQSSTNNSSWSTISNEKSSSITVTVGESTTYYRCSVSNGKAYSLYASMEVKVYNPEIRTADDLKNMLMGGDYVQKADIDLSDLDTNGGHDVNVKAEVIGGKLKMTVTYNDGSDKKASGVNVRYNNTVLSTDIDGVVEFTYDANAKTVFIGGVISQAENIAMTFDLDLKDNVMEITANSNGNFTPIGTFDDPFTGSYDGNGYRIFGIHTAAYSEAPVLDGSILAAGSGMFGFTLYGNIKNVAIESGSSLAIMNSGEYAIPRMASAGGVVGDASHSNIETSYNKGSVTAVGMSTEVVSAGGVVGAMTTSDVSDSFNAGNVTAIMAVSNAGGIVGFMAESQITNCFSTGKITASADTDAGGIVGLGVMSSYLTNCYYLKDTASDLCGGIGGDVEIDGGVDGRANGSGVRTADELKDKSKFYSGNTEVDGENVAGWDFDSVWKMGSNGPYLVETGSGGNDDNNGDDGIDPMIIVAVLVIAILVVVAAVFVLRKRK